MRCNAINHQCKEAANRMQPLPLAQSNCCRLGGCTLYRCHRLGARAHQRKKRKKSHRSVRLPKRNVYSSMKTSGIRIEWIVVLLKCLGRQWHILHPGAATGAVLQYARKIKKKERNRRTAIHHDGEAAARRLKQAGAPATGGERPAQQPAIPKPAAY